MGLVSIILNASVFASLAICFGVSAQTEQGTPLVLVADYKCQLIVVRDDHTKSFTKHFKSSFASGGHGGMEQTFGEGEDIVTVQATHNWLAVQWIQNEELLTVVHFVMAESSKSARVALILNPKNLNEQVTLDCEPDIP